MSRYFRFLAALLAVLAVGAAQRAAAEDRLSLPSRPGVTVAIWFQAAPSPVASVVLFAGGNGALDGVRGNFLIRVRGSFAAQGINVAAIDRPSDRAIADRPYRASADAATDMAVVIAFLKQKAAVPVWLVGTSNGSISAANGAARLGPAQISGLVLTSSVWQGGMQQVPLATIAVPTLVIHNRDDSCRISPPSAAEAAVASMTSAPLKELVLVSGGSLQSDPCEARSPHGYFGIENQVVPVMIQWIKAHGPGTTH
jgi:pimeloyl-ACP methyl ester carboxylesterase